ncbi:MAG: hypothetical protein KDE15_15910, partial [Erythrobacter sp.]|nr:hypothetical protein [Erythrobacter sp.]
MDEAGWAQVNAVLDEAVELPPAERDTLLEARLGSQPALLGRARAILASLTSSRAFLEPLVDHIPPAPPSLTGDRFGAWQVDGLLGRGGMGSVYRVSRVDGGFEQQAALKLMHGQRAVDLARFEAERQVLARLDHPGIARLLDGGIDAEGRPWMAMERIDGQPVDQWCNAAATPLAGRVAKVLDAIEAVAAAHRMLVLHRDLKP